MNEPDFNDMEQIREYVNMLAANVNRMILRERAQNTTIQYFAWMLDREGIEIDESCQRFIKVFGRVMNLESHLEHMEMDCEILNHALSSLQEECEIQFRIRKVKIHNKKFGFFFSSPLTTSLSMVYFSSSIENHKETQMFKSAIVSLVASAALAAPASAQWGCGYDWQERQILSAEFAATAARGAGQYCYSTGFAGPYAGQFVANAYNTTYAQTMNFNANLPYNGGFGCGYPYPTPIYPAPVYGGGCGVPAPIYGGGCAPVYGGGYGGGSWGVGIGGGVGQTIYGDNSVTTWGVGVNVGVGGGWGGW